jgi:SAM-dependent methyltransferase
MPSVLRQCAKSLTPWIVRHQARRLQALVRDWKHTSFERVVRPLLLRSIDLLSRPLVQNTADDPFHRNFLFFLDEITRRTGYSVLEVGSRNSDLRALFRGCRSYTGMDIHPGKNVDVVGDAHRLTEIFPGQRFDAVFSISVFEHLALPWKAALEMSRVLNVGGVLFVSTHPTWPAHELPWDFWRFSAEALKALLNPRLGFEVLCCDEGLPGLLLSLSSDKATRGVYGQPVRLGVTAVARKVAEPDPSLRWDIGLDEFLKTTYPLHNAA